MSAVYHCAHFVVSMFVDPPPEVIAINLPVITEGGDAYDQARFCFPVVEAKTHLLYPSIPSGGIRIHMLQFIKQAR